VSQHNEGRRQTLKIIGAIGGTCAYPFGGNELYGQQTPVAPPKQVHQHAGPPQRPATVPGRVKPGYFTDAEFDVIIKLADLIIPETDTPGAVGAGVPAYIDSVVGANKELQSIFRPGLDSLDKVCRHEHDKAFSALTEEQQIAVLTPWADAADKGIRNHEGGRFFRAMKNLTADGYYTSYIGLVQELEYKGNTVLGRFPDSTLPEH
jgi:Gluconate 2-dehydrogenase subunit 3